MRKLCFVKSSELPLEYIDLDGFKHCGLNLKAGLIQGWYRKAFGVAFPIEAPWLSLPAFEASAGRIPAFDVLLGRTTRFCNTSINYGFLGQTLSKDARWHGMVDRARAGFFLQDPVEFLCKGLSTEAREALRQRIAPDRPAYADEIIAGLSADGGRVVLMRVGQELVLDNPRGVDGSRQSYEKLIEQRCGQPPVFAFAHAHQAWINLALALGWAGALLFAGLLLYFTSSGVRGLRHESGRYWALALLLLSSFWILRGFTDAVYQEHYLQMQGLLLGYLWGRMKIEAVGPEAGR